MIVESQVVKYQHFELVFGPRHRPCWYSVDLLRLNIFPQICLFHLFFFFCLEFDINFFTWQDRRLTNKQRVKFASGIYPPVWDDKWQSSSSPPRLLTNDVGVFVLLHHQSALTQWLRRWLACSTSIAHGTTDMWNWLVWYIMHICIIHQRASFKAHSVHKSRNCCRFLWIRTDGAIDVFWGPRSETLALWVWKEQYKVKTFTFTLCLMHVDAAELQNSVWA